MSRALRQQGRTVIFPRRAPGGAWRLVTAATLCLAAGCASPPPPRPAPTPVFYPAPPAEPRLQYMTSYADERDLGATRNRLMTFLLGKNTTGRSLVKPYGLALADRRLYVCDSVAAAVEILDLERKEMDVFAPRGRGRLDTPIHIAVDRDGTRYVADSDRGLVLIYDSRGKTTGALGEGDAIKPTDVCIDGDRLYVTDLRGRNVRVYRKADRQRLGTVPAADAGEEARLYQPANLTVDSQGCLYVSDAGAFCVKVYDRNGQYVRTVGSHGDTPGQFARPRGIAVDREGRLFVVDAAMQNVQVFDAQGRLLLFFGSPGSSEVTFNLPAGILIDYEHVGLYQPYAAPGFKLEYLVLVANQYGRRKVCVLGFGKREQKREDQTSEARAAALAPGSDRSTGAGRNIVPDASVPARVARPLL
jgi:sugar lactone lactonase YvrE